MQLIVAEKPSVARDLARVLGVSPRGEHCFEGSCAITWCIGHLVELDEPASYDGRWMAWRLDTLPMLPDVFRLRGSKHAYKQLRAVAQLMRDRRFTAIVNACDAGREGELIFDYVYQFANARLPVQRLWVSSLTDDAIRRGFAQLRPPSRALADAARSRSEADWLVGMNATRAVTVRGGGTLYSIGRVQTPTLAMVVARDQAIAAFVPEPYWEVKADYGFAAGWRHGKVSRVREPVAAAIVARDTGLDGVVESVVAKQVREPPPLLFDLTSLQRTANKRFRLSAARTLEIAQALYERHKVLTYPRTDSRYLSSDVAKELGPRFEALATVPAYAPFASQLVAHPPRPSRRVVDDAKVHDHHAIIPTGKVAGLSGDEQRIFDLVARRFLAAFFPDAEFATTEAWIRVGPPGPMARGGEAEAILATLPAMPDRYLARGRVRLAAGWQAVAGIEPTDDIVTLPPLVEGQRLAGRYEAVRKQTTPPARFTDATLLAAMESAGKEVTDEALRAAMADCGLGTPATRASIIETLLQRGYVVRDKQALVATATGLALIDALVGQGEATSARSVVASLASAELTGSWEARLAAIARGTDSRDAFMADIRRYVTDVVGAICVAPPPNAPPAPPVGSCPKCGGEVCLRRHAFACECGFQIRDRVAGRVLSPALVAVLLRRRTTQVLRGFRSKAGKKFSARLVLDDAHEVRFAFDRDGVPSGDAAVRAKQGGEDAESDSSADDGRDRIASASADAAGDRNGGRRGPRSKRYRGNQRRSGGARQHERVAADGPPTPGREVRELIALLGSRGPEAVPLDGASGSAMPESSAHDAAARDARTAKRRPSRVRSRRSSEADAQPAVHGSATPDASARYATPDASRRPTRDPLGVIDTLACPRCKQGTLIAGSRGWGCTRWRDGCRFVIWFDTGGQRITPAQLATLVTKGKTRKGKAGRFVLDVSADNGAARLEPP